MSEASTQGDAATAGPTNNACIKPVLQKCEVMNDESDLNKDFLCQSAKEEENGKTEDTTVMLTNAQHDIDRILHEFVEKEDNMEPSSFIKEFYNIRVEQELLRRQDEYGSVIATSPLHFHRNRYRDILPYDTNRVVLRSVDQSENPEGYINASRVELPGSTKFIAAQAPLQVTLGDWWAMIEEYDVSLVVMLCRLVEMSKVKCERYWPTKVGESEIFGDNFEVTVESEEHFDDDDEYLLRKFRVENMTTGTSRTVHQLHYTEWPDHGCPAGEHQLLRMIEHMAQLHGKREAPILVHCSAGVGRTGTIIAINYVREMLESGKLVDLNLFALVRRLRMERASMVQTQDQYQFVHKCVSHYCKERLGLPIVEPEKKQKLTNGLNGAGNVSPPISDAPPPVATATVESDSDEDEEDEDVTKIPDYPEESPAPRGPEVIS